MNRPGLVFVLVFMRKNGKGRAKVSVFHFASFSRKNCKRKREGQFDRSKWHGVTKRPNAGAERGQSCPKRKVGEGERRRKNDKGGQNRPEMRTKAPAREKKR